MLAHVCLGQESPFHQAVEDGFQFLVGEFVSRLGADIGMGQAPPELVLGGGTMNQRLEVDDRLFRLSQFGEPRLEILWRDLHGDALMVVGRDAISTHATEMINPISWLCPRFSR